MDQLQFYYDYIISAVVFILLLTWMQHRQHTLVSLITIYPAIVTIIMILGLIIMMYYYTMTTVLWFHRACNTWSISIPVLSITAIYACLYRCGCIPDMEHANELACYVSGYLKNTETTNYAMQDIIERACLLRYCLPGDYGGY